MLGRGGLGRGGEGGRAFGERKSVGERMGEYIPSWQRISPLPTSFMK